MNYDTLNACVFHCAQIAEQKNDYGKSFALLPMV